MMTETRTEIDEFEAATARDRANAIRLIRHAYMLLRRDMIARDAAATIRHTLGNIEAVDRLITGTEHREFLRGLWSDDLPR